MPKSVPVTIQLSNEVSFLGSFRFEARPFKLAMIEQQPGNAEADLAVVRIDRQRTPVHRFGAIGRA